MKNKFPVLLSSVVCLIHAVPALAATKAQLDAFSGSYELKTSESDENCPQPYLGNPSLLTVILKDNLAVEGQLHAQEVGTLFAFKNIDSGVIRSEEHDNQSGTHGMNIVETRYDAKALQLISKSEFRGRVLDIIPRHIIREETLTRDLQSSEVIFQEMGTEKKNERRCVYQRR